MTKEVVGRVTAEEKNELMVLFERKLGIEELALTLENDLLTDEKKEQMQDKMFSELGRAKLKIQAWWEKMYAKYNWKSIQSNSWSIDFKTCEIFLMEE